MITISCPFAHIFKIMRIPQPASLLLSLCISFKLFALVEGPSSSCGSFSLLLSPMKISLTNLTMEVLGPISLPVCAFLHILNYLLIVLVDRHIINSQYPLVVSIEYL